LPVGDWHQDDGAVSLSPGIDATGADCLDIHDRRYFHPAESEYDGPAEYFVRSVDIDRELARAADVVREERPDETIAEPPPSPPGEEPKRTLRRWSAKYEWDAIYGEIARRCIDPKTRQVKVPKNESRLAEAVLQWCENNNKPQPGLTDMRDAVHAICAALRKG
jgi:hypothetical protein